MRQSGEVSGCADDTIGTPSPAFEVTRAEAASAPLMHQLRTLLTHIIGYTGALAAGHAGPLSVEQHRYLDIVREAERHVIELLDGELDQPWTLGARETGRHAYDVCEVAREAMELLRPKSESRGISVSVISEGPAWATGDRTRYVLVVLDLLSAALEGAHDRIDVRVRREDRHVTLAVTPRTDADLLLGDAAALSRGTSLLALPSA